MANYTRQEILDDLHKETQNMNTLYQAKMINYRGKTKDTKEYYSEIIAEYLLNNPSLFSQITPITRENSYRVESHQGTTPRPMSNRVEERIALSMYQKIYPRIGEVIDYQVPLKNIRADKFAGKIDLLSRIQDQLLILELKKPESTETLLRCVLEAATYWHRIDHKKLQKDWNFTSGSSIGKGILVFAGKAQHNELSSGEKPNTAKLLKTLGVDIFLIEELGSSGTYTVN